jgi:hypothetical protein
MDSNGEEQRIRALFRELRSDDLSQAPPLSRDWLRAQSPATQRGARFGRLRVATVSVVIALLVVSVLVLSNRRRQSEVADQRVKSSTTERQTFQKNEVVVQKIVAGGSPKPQKHFTSRRNRLTREKPGVTSTSQTQRVELSVWRSPTAILLSSAADRLLRSFPRVDQSSQEFKSFLPDRLN